MQTLTQSNQLPSESSTVRVEFDANTMEVFFNRVVPAASTFDDSSILSALFFEVQNGKLSVCATDGSRLVTFDEQGYDHVSNFTALVPAAVLRELESKWKKRTKGRTAMIVENGCVGFQILGSQITACGKLVNGQYPRYRELFPHSFKWEIMLFDQQDIFDGCELVQSMSRCLTKQYERESKNSREYVSNARAVCNTVVLDIVSGEHMESALGIRKNHPNLKLKWPICTTNFGDQLVIAFNAGYLTDALNATSKAGVKMFCNGPTKPAVFVDTDDRIKHLLMPVETK